MSKTRHQNKPPMMVLLLQRRMHYIPVFTAIFIISSFFLSYAISVYHGNVEPFFPYISYTAIHVPERCIFAQLINVGALLLAVNIYVRYLQMDQVLDLISGTRTDHSINNWALVIGWVSAFGLSMVANFQVVEMRAVHYTGAGLAFLLGLVYCWLQTSLSVRYSRWSGVAVCQLVNSCCLSAVLLVFVVSKSIYKVRQLQGHGTKWDTLRGVYLTSTISEWLMAASIVTFVLTFYRDFSRIEFKSPRVRIKNTDIVLQDYNFGCRPSASESTEPVVQKQDQNGLGNIV